MSRLFMVLVGIKCHLLVLRIIVLNSAFSSKYLGEKEELCSEDGTGNWRINNISSQCVFSL